MTDRTEILISRRKKHKASSKDTLFKDRDEAVRRLQVLRDQQIIDPSDIKALRESLEGAFGTLLAFYDLICNADDVELAPKPKRKRAPAITLASLATRYLKTKATDINPLTEQMPQIEFEILLDRLVECGIAKPIPGYCHIVEIPEYKLTKRRYHAVRHQRIGAKGITYKQHFGVLVTPDNTEDNLPPFLLLTGTDDLHLYAVLYHSLPTEEFGRLYDWFQQKRRDFSPFRGQVCVFQGDSLNFVRAPRNTSWNQIIPEPDVQTEFQNCLHMMVNAADYRQRGIPVRRGVILAGPPGTGKTVHLQSFVTDVLKSKLPVIQVMSGVNTTTLEYAYQIADNCGPALVILEDIDTITAKREDEYGNSYGRIDMLAALLTVLDGSERRDGVITVATTNAPGSIDRALAARPGRFDRLFRFEYLPANQREKILQLHADQRSLSFDILAHIKGQQNGSRDLSWVLNEDGVTPAHLAEAVDSIIRDLTRDPETNPSESLERALGHIKHLVSPDDRFTTKNKGTPGFVATTEERV